MGGAATRGRKKAVTEEDEAAVVAAATHRDEMQACKLQHTCGETGGGSYRRGRKAGGVRCRDTTGGDRGSIRAAQPAADASSRVEGPITR